MADFSYIKLFLDAIECDDNLKDKTHEVYDFMNKKDFVIEGFLSQGRKKELTITLPEYCYERLSALAADSGYPHDIIIIAGLLTLCNERKKERERFLLLSEKINQLLHSGIDNAFDYLKLASLLDQVKK
ncbi:hypothetical protein ACI8BE_002300 [Proteus mirabilis]|uniref:hypothetical protein n=1 Tax=Morganellaceae TaxID=1903414 RepID=UPI001EFEC717|nr:MULTISPECIES: hypothetical protein [Morganellaceae]MCG9537135.1 hypothetical protein [Providencia huaxiensis]